MNLFNYVTTQSKWEREREQARDKRFARLKEKRRELDDKKDQTQQELIKQLKEELEELEVINRLLMKLLHRKGIVSAEELDQVMAEEDPESDVSDAPDISSDDL